MPSTPWVVLFAVQWAALIFIVFVLVGLARKINGGGQVAVQPGPEAALSGLPGLGTRLEPAQLPDHVIGSAAVVLFLSSTCGPCLKLGEALKSAAQDGPGLPQAMIVIVTDRTDETLEAAGLTVVVDPTGSYKEKVNVIATPTGIAIDHDGRVCGTDIPNSLADVEALARSVGHQPDDGRLVVLQP